MCGIFAYLNYQTPLAREQILKILLCALRALENKGYDSAGLAISGSTGRSIELVKRAGLLDNLESDIQGLQERVDLKEELHTHLGLAHTRWATHGEASDINAHPQSSGPGNEFVVIHNGIITNYKELSQFLVSKGMHMESETDTEVIVKLMSHLFNHNNPPTFYQLVEAVVTNLEGAFALVFKSVHYPEEAVLACKGSPMLIGVRSSCKLATDYIPLLAHKSARGGSNSPQVSSGVWTLEPSTSAAPVEFFVASDANAIIGFTNKVIYLQDNDVASIKSGKLTIHKLAASSHRSLEAPSPLRSGQACERQVTLLQNEILQLSKGDFSSYMEKEIHEQVESVMNTMRGRVNFETGQVTLGGIKAYTSEIGRCRRLLVIACASSYHAAVATRQLIEELTELSVMVEQASDFLDRTTPIFRDDVCIFLSQSGETADTLQSLRYCKERGALIVAVTNSVGSSICRESHCGIHANAGPEVGVASTKTYTSQIISLVLFSLVMCQDRICLQERRRNITQALKLLPGQISELLQRSEQVLSLAEELKDEKSLLFIGRGYNYASCLEGALKIKELTYMHSEGLNAGELKHGPLALVDQLMPMIIFATKDSVYEKSINALQQISARQGKAFVVCTEGDEEVKKLAHRVFEIPMQVDCLQGVLSIIPMQLLALHIAHLKQFNVDHPRSLLKHYSEGDF